MSAVRAIGLDRPRRRTILWLLALNLFVTSALLAFAVRHFLEAPQPRGKVTEVRRIEALANRLAPDDASILRTEFLKKSEAIEQARERFTRSREAVRVALRAEPYVPAATRDAMSDAETAHRRLEQLFQELIASAAAKMTAQGRSKLADFQPGGRAQPEERSKRFFPRFTW
jgi:hypothetical protein